MRLTGRNTLITLLAATACALSGCFGLSQNPSYFPHLLPTGDIIRTHAKPPLGGYYSDFDPHALKLEVRPLESTSPVRTQHVIIATVYDEKGEPRRNRRVEWLVEGAGNIIEVDESGFFPGRGYKVDNKYAVSYTNYHEHTITRGNSDPNDDFVVRPGQSWCVISSAVEGDTYVTVYAPGIFNWDTHKIFVTKHWIDAEWVVPPPAVNRIGTEHVLVTNVFRHTDRQPLANYRVRYRVIDGPPAVFLPNRTPEFVATSDLSGNATATMVQALPQAGVNRISVEVIRPPDPRTPSGAGIVIGRGETTKQWQGGQVSLTVTGPPTAIVNQDIPYTVAVQNAGQIEVPFMTVRSPLPEGLQLVRAIPQPIIESNQLVWTFGILSAGQTQSIQVSLRAVRPGPVTYCAAVTTAENVRDEKCVTTQVVEGAAIPPTLPPGTQPAPSTPPTPTQPLQPQAVPQAQLNLTMSEPPNAFVGVPLTYQITVTNSGTAPATNVLLSASFDPSLEHETKADPVELPPFPLGAGEVKTVPLVLVPRRAGQFVTRVSATADGNLRAETSRTVTVQAARMTVTKSGPKVRYVDQNVTWDITVANTADTPLANVAVRDPLPAEVTFVNATGAGQFLNGQVAWTLGSLAAREQRTVQVTARCTTIAPRVLNTAIATADPGLQEQGEALLEIRGVPGFKFDVTKSNGAVPIGGSAGYKITVTNTGTLPANQVEIAATVPPELAVTNTSGPNQARVEGDRVLFPALDGLQPKQTFTYFIEVKARKAGDVRFRVELRSASLSQPVVKEQPTNIFDPANGTVPAGPPAR
jgi:uncharacterized repeat protein (TIGR01451 family)